MIMDLLNKLEMEPDQYNILDAIRIKQGKEKNRDNKEFTTDLIKIQFDNPRGKYNMYRAMATHGKDHKSIKISDAIPKDLVPQKKFLEKVAAAYRKYFKGAKTRVQCRSGDMHLNIKETGTTKFQTMEINTAKKAIQKVQEKNEEDGTQEENKVESVSAKRKKAF
jgi:hypothetical protein